MNTKNTSGILNKLKLENKLLKERIKNLSDKTMIKNIQKSLNEIESGEYIVL